MDDQEDMRGRTVRTLNTREAFIAALTESGNVTKSCQMVGIGRMTAYDWRREDPDFAAAWDAALEVGIDGLEDEANRRGHDGWDEPVFFQGQEVGVVRKYSDALLLALLKANRPEKYRERRETVNTHLGADGKPTDNRAVVNVTIAGNPARNPDE